jgi:hypothetical protein
MSTEQPGYRGALPPRGERMARVWVALVILGFVAITVLAFLNVPTVLIPEPTPLPVPSVSPSTSDGASPAESGSPAESVSASPSVSPAESRSPAPTP